MDNYDVSEQDLQGLHDDEYDAVTRNVRRATKRSERKAKEAIGKQTPA